MSTCKTENMSNEMRFNNETSFKNEISFTTIDSYNLGISHP